MFVGRKNELIASSQYVKSNITIRRSGPHIIPEMERKCTLVKPPRGYADEKDGHISLYEIMYV